MRRVPLDEPDRRPTRRKARAPRAPAPQRRRRALQQRTATLRAGAVLSGTFHLASQNFALFLGLALLAYLPSLAFEFWTHDQAAREYGGRFVQRTVGVEALGSLIELLGLMFLTGAITYIVVEQRRGRDPAFARAVSVSVGRLVSMIGIAFMMCAMIVGVWLLFGLIPMMYASLSPVALIIVGALGFLIARAVVQTRFCAAIPVTVVEGRSAVQSMVRSDRLTHGVRWTILGTGVVVLLGPTVLNGFARSQWMNASDWKLAVGVAFVAQLAGGILLATFCAVVYHDTRTSIEGIDPGILARTFD